MFKEQDIYRVNDVGIIFNHAPYLCVDMLKWPISSYLSHLYMLW